MIQKGSLVCGDIVWANFNPSTGHEYKKGRPALIVQSDAKLSVSSLATIIPLSSKTAKAVTDDILIAKNSDNNLFADSVLKVHYISSFDYVRFSKKVGRITQAQMSQVKSYLATHFDLKQKGQDL